MLSDHLRKKMNDSASKMLEEKHESEDSGMSLDARSIVGACDRAVPVLLYEG